MELHVDPARPGGDQTVVTRWRWTPDGWEIEAMTDPEGRGWVSQEDSMPEDDADDCGRGLWHRLRFWDTKVAPFLTFWILLGAFTLIASEGGWLRANQTAAWITGAIWGVALLELAKTDDREEYIEGLYFLLALAAVLAFLGISWVR
jgi:hypothetical protein